MACFLSAPRRPRYIAHLIGPLSLALAGVFSVWTPASAQTVPPSDAVVVDLSVLGGSSGALPFGGQGGGQLQLPPARSPVSTLHVAPTKTARTVSAPKKRMTEKTAAMEKSAAGPVAKQPMSAPAKTAAAPAPPKKIAAEPKPAKKMKAPEVAKTPAPKPASAQSAASKLPPPPPAPAAAPKPAPPPAPAAQTPQQAAAPASDLKPGRAYQVVFGATELKLPEAAKAQLKSIADSITDKQDLRLQLMAYAGGKELSASKARRMSLSRALSVRSFLIESGMRSTRIDVRAEGSKTSEEPLNRVDVNVARR